MVDVGVLDLTLGVLDLLEELVHLLDRVRVEVAIVLALLVHLELVDRDLLVDLRLVYTYRAVFFVVLVLLGDVKLRLVLVLALDVTQR